MNIDNAKSALKTTCDVLPVLLFFLLFGCAAVGPDYVPPETRSPETWHTDAKDGLAAAETDPEMLAAWWKTLNDPTLSSLMDRAVEGSLSFKSARARVLEARARRSISLAGLYPSVDVSGRASRNRVAEERGGGEDFSLYAAGFDAAWELDVFGGQRRAIEASEAHLEATEEELRDVLVSLLSEVALNYVEVRTLQMGIAVALGNLEAQESTLQLTRSRFEAGLTNELAVQQATYNLENTRSKIPALRIGLESAMNRLSVLLGQPPGTLHAELEQRKPIPIPPLEVAVGIPAEVLRRRPDVRQAERLLAAQTARVGAATADLYPRFRLLGSIGAESLSLGNLFSASGLAYLIGGAVRWPLYDAGAIRSRIEVQSALQEQALLHYEFTILKALEEVETAMIAYLEEQKRFQALNASATAAERAVVLSESQYQAGLTEFTAILDAQRSLLSFQEQLAQSEGAVTANLVRLYKALGGGWTTLLSEKSFSGPEKAPDHWPENPEFEAQNMGQ